MTTRVATIYFETLTLERSLYNGKFTLPAVKKGLAPVIVEIRDHTQGEKLPHVIGAGVVRRQIVGQEIAADLVKALGSGAPGMNPNCGPGIWLVRDFAPVLDERGIPQKDLDGRVVLEELSPEQKAQFFTEDRQAAEARQDAWIKALLDEADALWADPNPGKRIMIGPQHKAACIYAGRKREWLMDFKAGDRISCPFCQVAVPLGAAVCQNCHNVIDSVKYERLKASVGNQKLNAPGTPGGVPIQANV